MNDEQGHSENAVLSLPCRAWQQERSGRHRAAGLDQMVADAENAGLYDLPADVPFERLPIEGGRE